MKKRKVAIFDIDGTIFRSSLLIELTDAFIQEGIFPASARRMYARAFAEWLERRGTYEEYILAVVHAFLKHIKGVRYADFLRVGKKVVIFHKSRVYRYTRDLVHDLKRRGYYLLAITQSPKLLAEPFCETLGFDKVYGRMYEVDGQKRFTGNILHLDLIADKANIVRRAVEGEHLTLRGSVGVGDTEGDISFLSLVAKPICFNPNAPLYAHAKRAGWRVVVERKDVIYKNI